MDSGGKGYITGQDTADALGEAASGNPAPAAKAHPARGGGPASEAIDPADTNQDGQVTAAEEMAYILKHYNASSGLTIADGPNNPMPNWNSTNND